MEKESATQANNFDDIIREDASHKAGGHAEYIADLKWEGMLFAKTLRSPHPRARIASIAIPTLPSGYFTVDHRDVPGKNRVKMKLDDFPFFAEQEVNYVGEPILLVVGPDKQKIEQIISEITVRYDPMDPIYNTEDAAGGVKPPLYGSDNLFCEYEITSGDPDRFLGGVELTSGSMEMGKEIITDQYRTGYQEHIYMESQGVVGLFDGYTVTLYGSMQCPYYIKSALVQGFGWEEDRIRIIQTTTGGAFGGKEEYPSLIAGQAAFAAVKIGKPVQLVFDRSEDILATTKRHPALIKIRSALSRGSIQALEIEIILDGGAYAGLTSVVLQRALFAASGVYRIPNLRIRGKAYATNNVPTGAFRGFGAPQAFFAIETFMHNLAIRLGEDPLDFKRKYAVQEGDPTVTGGKFRHAIKLEEMIAEVKRMSHYDQKYRTYSIAAAIPEASSGGDLGAVNIEPERGIGISLFFHGCGFTGSGEKDQIKAQVKLRKRGDTVEILVASTEMGQGAQTTLKKIVGRVLDLPLARVIYQNPDTARVPDSGPTVASRTVMIVGRLLERAARELKEKWDVAGNKAGDIEVVKNYRQPDYLKWNQETFQGDAYPAYSWGVNAVEVAVDPLTYEVVVTGVWSAYDIGTAIDRRIIRGQIDGGLAQGIGYATLEVLEVRDGRLKQDSMTDYMIPTSVDLPRIESILLDNPYESGPFGAKGAGELPLIGTAPAIAAAIQNALGIPVHEIPITPEYLLEIMEKGRV